MSTDVIMPQMGESVAEGTVTKWLKKVGDRVERDEPLLEISTDKVDAEIPSPVDGVLAKILVRESETVAVNTVVATIDGEKEGVGTAPEEDRAATQAAALEASIEIARSAGPAIPASPVPSGTAAPEAAAPRAPGPRGKVRSSPLVRRIAREHNVDLAFVRGTGLGGRISKKDILEYIAHPAPQVAVAPSVSMAGDRAAPRPAPTTVSPTGISRRASPSSYGAAFPTTICWTSRNKAS